MRKKLLILTLILPILLSGCGDESFPECKIPVDGTVTSPFNHEEVRFYYALATYYDYKGDTSSNDLQKYSDPSWLDGDNINCPGYSFPYDSSFEETYLTADIPDDIKQSLTDLGWWSALENSYEITVTEHVLYP